MQYWQQGVIVEGPECPERQIPPAAAERIANRQADRAALVALYNATNGDQWTNNIRWLSGQPLGKWHGVTTDDQGRVTALDLVAYTANYTSMISNNLTGELPPELGNLSELVSLEIYDSNLTGPIPPELGNLSKLRGLGLRGNNLTGSIPPELGNLSSLHGLDLSGNNLTGSIPAELGNLEELGILYLQGNNLAGPLPLRLTQLQMLYDFNFADNPGLCAPAALHEWIKSIQYLDGPNC